MSETSGGFTAGVQPSQGPRTPLNRLLTAALGLACGLLAVVAAVLALGPRRLPPATPDTGQTVVRVDTFGGATLSIASVPAGATVIVNGRLTGATPVCMNGLPTGAYSIRLERRGCKPLSKCVALDGSGLELREELEPVPTGGISVDVKPQGSEVLLDGEIVGNTPLKAGDIPVGSYELLIRKTNYDTYARRIEVEAGETLPFAGFELRDKILTMLEGQLRSEPQRLAHYIDLGHYHFVNDRMDDAVYIFAQGMQVMQTPLDFDGPGFPGKDRMLQEERDLEVRLRTEDQSRFTRELEKHRSWPRKDTRAFREKLEKAQEVLSQKNITSWPWIETAGRMNIRSQRYDKAEKLYIDYIAAAGKAPDVQKAYVALIELYCMQRQAPQARAAFDKYLALYQNDGAALRACGSTIYPYYDRMSAKGRTQVLEIAEQALRRALDLLKEPAPKAQCMFELGVVLTCAGRAKEAVPLFEQAIAAAPDPATKEERSLRLADALRKADRIPEAEALFNKLKTSKSDSIREAAKTGLIYVEGDKARQRSAKPGK